MEQLQKISLDKIDSPHIAMRTELDDSDMEDLMSSMRERGLIEPVVLRAHGDRFEIIAGDRRTRAARRLGWAVIPAIVREATDEETLDLRLAENADRSNVNIADEACYYGEIILRHKWTPEQLAEKLHRKVEWVKVRLAIFDMPDLMKEHLRRGLYPIGAALWIAKLEPESKKMYYANHAAFHGCTIAAAKLWYDLSAANIVQSTERLELVKSEDGQILSARGKTECARCGALEYSEYLENVMVHKSEEICLQNQEKTQ